MSLLLLLGCGLWFGGDYNCPTEYFEPTGPAGTAEECVADGLCPIRCSSAICPEAPSETPYWCEECGRVNEYIAYGNLEEDMYLEFWSGSGLFLECDSRM